MPKEKKKKKLKREKKRKSRVKGIYSLFVLPSQRRLAKFAQ